MRYCVYFAIITFIFLISSCDNEIQKPTKKIIDGVEVTYNGKQPLYQDRTVLFEEEMIIGEGVESEKAELFEPWRFIVDKENNLYVYDNSDKKIKVFNSEGKFINSIGRNGKGPGEFNRVSSFIFSPDKRLIVLDGILNRLSVFNAGGELISTAKLEDSYKIYLCTDTSIVSDYEEWENETKLFIKEISFEGKEIKSFGRFTEIQMHTKKVGRGLISISLPYPEMSIFSGDKLRGLLYHCMNSKYQIEVFDQSGKLIRKFQKPYDLVPFTNRDKEEYYNSFRSGSQANELTREVELPKYKTVTEFMIADDIGNLWVQTNEIKKVEDKELTAYDIFDKEGFYTSRVWSEIEPKMFVNGKMYTWKVNEETEVKSIVRYNVKWVD